MHLIMCTYTCILIISMFIIIIINNMGSRQSDPDPNNNPLVRTTMLKMHNGIPPMWMFPSLLRNCP